VVTKDVPPDSLVVGAPAKVKKNLKEETQVAAEASKE
jgi:acetyltransferase-like isoleucine patch superfamily enzyme